MQGPFSRFLQALIKQGTFQFCRGSGQITDQGARLVDIALDNGNAFNGDGWKYISAAFAKNTVHFIGLLSDGGVHSRYDQLAAFLKGAKKSGAKSIRVHILTVPLWSQDPVWTPSNEEIWIKRIMLVEKTLITSVASAGTTQFKEAETMTDSLSTACSLQSFLSMSIHLQMSTSAGWEGCSGWKLRQIRGTARRGLERSSSRWCGCKDCIRWRENGSHNGSLRGMHLSISF